MEVQMSAMSNPTQSESSADPTPANPSVEAPAVCAVDLKKDRFPNGRSALGKRVLVGLVRFLIMFCIGVAATLAWQSYGDAARERIASSYPQLGWLALQAAPIARSAPDTIGLAAQAAPSPDQQRINAMSLDLDAVRQNIDRITTTQEQITRRVDQLTAGEEQMTREITKIQAVEQSIPYKKSEPPPRPTPAPAPPPLPPPAPPPPPRPH